MEKISYQISSRAAILLGRESVSKVDGAIIELIKNTYDADASFCVLSFDTDNDAIYIIDDGTGMNRDIIENCWMLIGTDNKRLEYKSRKNRIKSGEKGIGRFALDRLGSVCEMFTKNASSKNTLYWKTDWGNFEEAGKTINEVAADLDYLAEGIANFLPTDILKSLDKIDSKIVDDYRSGTILKITGLRDKWTNKSIEKIINMLAYIIPNNASRDYIIYAQPSPKHDLKLIENEMIDEFDYKLKAYFNGEKFNIQLIRNEYDLSKIPDDVFKLKEFQSSPYTKNDFVNSKFDLDYSIEELINSNDKKLIEVVKEIGKFSFEYTFLKATVTDDLKETFYYKDISSKRRIWLNQNAGIKIYRDNFLVRPYGDVNSDSFDWLNLDARKASSPAGLAHDSGSWRVRNSQGYGSVYISRIDNSKILDKSSREGIIDNEYYTFFKIVLANIINVFEKDRQYISRGLKKYKNIVDESTRKKEEGLKLAEKIIKEKKDLTKNQSKVYKENEHQNKSNYKDTEEEKLAETVLLIDEEKENLLSEIKLLRSLATNGLITTSIVHDLTNLSSLLIKRSDKIKEAYDYNEKRLLQRELEDLKRNDSFLSSWISVVMTQLKKDKRKRTTSDLYIIAKNLKNILAPLLEQKKITLNIHGEENTAIMKLFAIDFESLICNLIINSIDAFRKIETNQRIIDIKIDYDLDNVFIYYKDNGPGISKTFKDPYEIFNFGTTDKKSLISGEIEGTGIGMYIVASTIREYDGEYIIRKQDSGFSLEIRLPQKRR